jgi:hypothetical protein
MTSQGSIHFVHEEGWKLDCSTCPMTLTSRSLNSN